MSLKAPTLQHRVEVPDQEDSLAHRALPLRDEVPRPVHLRGHLLPPHLEPEPIELRPEDLPDPPHPSEVLGGAVDVDDAFEKLDRLLPKVVDEVRNATLLGR